MGTSPNNLARTHTSALSGRTPLFSLQGPRNAYMFSSPNLGERGRLEVASSIHGDTYPKNIVLFGETGVGKSSVINLIAGQGLAQTSNDAVGCTAQPRRYVVNLPTSDSSEARSESEPGSGPVTISLWDTAGLDEGSKGTVPAATSSTHLQSLLQTLAHSPAGIHLLLFCIRGTARPTQALRHHYDLVYSCFCRGRVRIALVVTGLEHQYLEGLTGMETWWGENEGTLRELGMRFDEHVCVTAKDVQEGIGQERWLESQRRLRELLAESIQPDMNPWEIKPILRDSLPTTGGLLRKQINVISSGLYRIYGSLVQWLAAKVMSADYVPAEGARATSTDPILAMQLTSST